MILDWRKIINDEINPWEERSKTKQDIFNKQINAEAAKFYKEELVPQWNLEMKEKLGDGEWISVDTEDELVVLTIDVERTFGEKLSIFHKIVNF